MPREGLREVRRKGLWEALREGLQKEPRNGLQSRKAAAASAQLFQDALALRGRFRIQLFQRPSNQLF
jgi:hypothetical protein